MEIWPLADIVQFMDTHGIGLSVKGSEVKIDANSVAGKQDKLALVLPHMKARKEELIEYFRKQEPFRLVRPGKRTEAEQNAFITHQRGRVIASLTARITQAGSGRIWYLLPTGLAKPCTPGELPKEAIAAALEGDKDWQPLPRYPIPVAEYTDKERRRYWAARRQSERYKQRGAAH